MIKNATYPIWEKLIRGELDIAIKQVSAQLMLNRCQRNLLKDPSSENIEKLKSDVHTFFTKFDSILQDELNQLFG